jgi:hypothetical protein
VEVNVKPTSAESKRFWSFLFAAITLCIGVALKVIAPHGPWFEILTGLAALLGLVGGYFGLTSTRPGPWSETKPPIQ